MQNPHHNRIAPHRIVIQGVRGAFHEIAARKFYGDQVEVVPALSFPELFEKTADDTQADAAVLAIENSIAGSILGNYNLLQNSNLRITGELVIPIRQNLMALPGVTMADIKEVHSHPMALAQCTDYFKQYPSIRLVESQDTAESAARISRKHLKHTAAIGSTLAAEIYGLDILAPNIETNSENFTRFLAVQPVDTALPIEKANKVSVSFTTPHSPGSLSRILTMLAAQSANLTKIQSVPLLGRPWEYLFFMDFSVNNPAIISETIRLLEVMTAECKILGIYKENNG